MKLTIEHKYDITDEVYHITPDSPKAVVVDWRFCRASNEVLYEVSVGFGQEYWCTERELTPEKTFS